MHCNFSKIEIKSRRRWKENSLGKLLGPLNIHFDRTKRAFTRWKEKNLYLEGKVIKKGNVVIRDLLLNNGHLIPVELLEDAGKLIEHYDVWLEQFAEHRDSQVSDPTVTFVFAGPEGYPFPRSSEQNFRNKFVEYWNELYGNRL